jgi:hypothetical protein
LFTERTNNILFLLALGTVFWFSVCAIDSSALPERWSSTQTVAGEYEVSRDWKASKTGKASAHIGSKVDDPKGVASIRQEFRPFAYLKSRVRMEAWVKTALSSGSASLWLQVSGPRGGTVSLSDTGEYRITGHTDWTRHEIVVRIPQETRTITFGFAMTGKGEAWVDDFSFQVLGEDGGGNQEDWLQRPVNLGFE